MRLNIDKKLKAASPNSRFTDSKKEECTSENIKTTKYKKTEKYEIYITSTVKYLRIYIDEELNFKYHITSIVAKISRGVGILYKIKNVLPPSTLLCVYYSLVHTHLSYGIIIWKSTYKLHLEKLSLLQNKALQAVGGAEWNESSSFSSILWI